MGGQPASHEAASGRLVGMKLMHVFCLLRLTTVYSITQHDATSQLNQFATELNQLPRSEGPTEPTAWNLVNEASDPDAIPPSPTLGFPSSLKLSGGVEGSRASFVEGGEACGNGSTTPLAEWSILNHHLVLTFTPKAVGRLELCYAPPNAEPMRYPSISIEVPAPDQIRPDPQIVLATTTPLTIVWWDKGTAAWPARHSVRAVWFSPDNLGLEVREVTRSGGDEQQYWDKSIVVLKAEQADVIRDAEEYFRKKPEGYKMGLFHIGDFDNDPNKHRVWDHATRVFRLHYLSVSDKVHYIPHGPADGFKPVKPLKPIAERQHLCSFLGWDAAKSGYTDSPAQADRTAMLDALKDVCNIQLHSGWSNSEMVHEYTQLMGDTRYALIPNGIGPETFRLYEAIESGCVPVMTRSHKQDYLAAFPSIPWVILDSWDQLPAVVEQSKGKAQTMADNSVQFWSQLREAKKKEVRTEVINSIMSQND